MRIVWLFLLLLVSCADPEEQMQAVERQLWFEEIALQTGIDFTYHSGDTGHFYIIETMGGGAALFDYDNDGDLDLYLTQGNALGSAINPALMNTLYENDGTGKFKDVTAFSESGDPRYSIGVATGDYNNDGYVDLFVTNFGRNTLFKNNKDGTFQDVTLHAGVGETAFSACAEFADLDLDGDLDLFVTNYLDWSVETEKECISNHNRRGYCIPSAYEAPIADTLYFNNGDGTFTDVSEKSGIANVKGTGLGLAIATINDDKWPDIFVANDGMEDRLWINQGDGTFEDKAMILGCAVDDSGYAKGSMGVALMDLDNDSDLDLLVTTLWRETDSLFINMEGVFVDASARWGLAADTRTFTRWGIEFVDFNNDGLVDLYEATGRVSWRADNWDENNWLAEPNLLFIQEKKGRFSLVKHHGGLASPLVMPAHGIASGDVNGDGGIDLVIVNKDAKVNVLINVFKDRGNWIVLDVRNEYGSPALGAIAEVLLLDGSKVTKHVRSNHGYASASDPRVHIGLGTDINIQSVSIQWPNGHMRIFGSLQSGLVHKLTP